MANKPDPEMIALRRIENALANLDMSAKTRVLRFVAERVGDAHRKQMIENPPNPPAQTLAAVPPPA